MIKRFLIIVVVANLVGIVMSCCKEDIYFKWVRISTELIDNSGIVPNVTSMDRINKNAFGIRIYLQDSILYYACLPRFYNSAYATTCARNYISSSVIKDVSVTTLYDFDEVKTKGTEMSDYFTARLSQDYKSDYCSIPDIIIKFNDRNSFPNLDGYGRDKEAFDLFLMEQSNKKDTCQFQVEIKFKDETSIKCLTRKLILF